MSAATITHVWTHHDLYGDEHWVRHKVVRQTPHFVFVAQVGDDDDGGNYPQFTRQQAPHRIKTERLLSLGLASVGCETFWLKPVMHDFEVWRPTEWGFVHDEAATRELQRQKTEATERDPAYLNDQIEGIEYDLRMIAAGQVIVASRDEWVRAQRVELARLRAKLQELEVAQ